MNSKSRQFPALLCSASCACLLFQPLVWTKKKQEGKTEHKLSDAWTYEYLSVNASRWTSRPSDNTDGVSRESALSSGGFIWPWNDITTRRFRGNRSICLRTDGAETVYDRSHHMCQTSICQQLKVTTYPSGFVFYNFICCRTHAWTCAWICCFTLTEIPLQGSMCAFRLKKGSGTCTHNQHVTLACQNNLCWRTQCDMLSVLWEWGVQSSHH